MVESQQFPIGGLLVVVVHFLHIHLEVIVDAHHTCIIHFLLCSLRRRIFISRSHTRHSKRHNTHSPALHYTPP